VVAMLVAGCRGSIRYSLRQVRDVAVTISEGNLLSEMSSLARIELGELGHAIKQHGRSPE